MDNQLCDHLQRLELEQYIPLLRENGYTSWSQVMAIKEEDFNYMGFKLGHRRKLQREIANMEGYPQSEALPYSGRELAQLSLPRPLKISAASPLTKGNKQLRKRHAKSRAHVLNGVVIGVPGGSQSSQAQFSAGAEYDDAWADLCVVGNNVAGRCIRDDSNAAWVLTGTGKPVGDRLMKMG